MTNDIFQFQAQVNDSENINTADVAIHAYDSDDIMSIYVDWNANEYPDFDPGREIAVEGYDWIEREQLYGDSDGHNCRAIFHETK